MIRNSFKSSLRLTASSLSSKASKSQITSISRAIPAASSSLLPSTSILIFTSRSYATATTPTSSTQDPSESEALEMLNQGTRHLEAGEVEQAKAAYERSLQIKQTSPAAFNLGVTKYHEKDLEGAIESWELSLKISPDSPDAHTNLASAYVLSKPSRPDLAVKHLKTAANLSPSDPEIQYNLGAVLEALEQLEDALKAYTEAKNGGIERADQNIRNCQAKLMAAKVNAQAEMKNPKSN